MIERYINTLRSSFGGLKPLVKDEEMLGLFKRREYSKMILSIKRMLRLDMRITVGFVNNGGPNTVAWVKIPENLPLYGSDDFRMSQVIVYIRKTFLEKASFEAVVLAIAHELTHIVLDATRHELRRKEEAVDLAAMLFGFRDFFVSGCVEYRSCSPCETEKMSIGYLTLDEALYASFLMTFPEEANNTSL